MNEKVMDCYADAVPDMDFPEMEFGRNGQEFLHERVCEIKKAGNPENCQMEKERKNI